MLQQMEGLPENVVAVSASGRVTGDDYESVLLPAVERARARNERIRFLYRVGTGFVGFTAAALWDDATVGLRNRKSVERIAVVTDFSWVANAVKVFGIPVACPVKVFRNSDLAAAKAWVSA